MKIRAVIIEADDVSGSDIQELLSRAIPAPVPAVSLPAPAAQTSLPPQQARVEMAPLNPGWQPRTPTPRKRERTCGPRRERDPKKRNTQDPRPVIESHLLCNGCGHSQPVRMGPRPSCPKCGANNWDKVEGKAPIEISGGDNQ